MLDLLREWKPKYYKLDKKKGVWVKKFEWRAWARAFLNKTRVSKAMARKA